MTVDLFMLIVTLVNIGLVLVNLCVLGIGVKLYTDHRKQGLLKEIGK